MECYSNGMSLKVDVTKKGMSFNMEYHYNIILLKMKYHSKGNVTQNGISLKIEYHFKWKVPLNKMSLKMDTSIFS